MQPLADLQSWLRWVIRIRFVIISVVFAIELALRHFAPRPSGPSLHALAATIILWYVLGLFYLIYNQLGTDYLLQANLQIYSDLFVITAVVHVTGDLDSSYSSLYVLAIIFASVLQLPRAQGYQVAGVSFILLGSLLEVAYLPSLYPDLVASHPTLGALATSSPQVDLVTLQVKIGASLFGFFAVAYLVRYLEERLRQTGAELKVRRGQVASLQAIKEHIIRSMRGGLISTDLDGKITEANPAGAAILGRSPEALRGLSILEVLPGAELERPSGSSPPAISRREFLHHDPGGEQRTLGISASALVVPEIGVVGCVYTFQDLTDEKRRQAENRVKERMATLGRMASAIAHEIRNPLASIGGSVKLLRNLSSLDEDQAKLISIVTRESERLNKLVSDFLLYSRDQRFELREVDIANLMEETLLLLEHHPLFGSRTRIERKLPSRPVLVSADADRLRQVFWNICDNALKAMPEGGTLTAGIEEDGRPDDGYVRVMISDTGIGFPEEHLKKVFEPFQSGFQNGTGLGLAIVYQLIEGHGGRIRLESAPGKGASFVIDLPRKRTGDRSQKPE
ncbi:MAG: two-component system sensor histidine kinase NtrB [Terriglobia bacterium]